MVDKQNDVTWKDKGACLKVEDPDLFFPESGEGDEAAQKAVCRTCEVIQPCLMHAIASNDDDDHVWGGLNLQERRAITWLMSTGGSYSPA